MKKPKNPHILILMTDQQRADHTPMEDHPYVESPTIAEIAEHGTYFRNAYVPSPVCVPGRQSILADQKFPRTKWGLLRIMRSTIGSRSLALA